MSAVEFLAPAGKTFSAQLYNAVSGAAIGAPIAGIVDAVPTRYRFSTGSNTGIVYLVATATTGNARMSGYADLDSPINGYSPLRDSVDELNTDAIASDVYSKLAGGRSTLLSGPVAAGGPLDQVKTVDLSYTIPITLPATSELQWFMRCHPDATNAYLIASKSVGLTQLMTNTSPTAAQASITRNANNVAIAIKAVALSQLPSETVACELREITQAGDVISRHEVEITLRHSAGRN